MLQSLAMVRPGWSREPVPRQNHWQQDRPGTVPTPDDRRYPEAHDIRRPPLGIDQALREHCNIPAKHYFVAAVLDDNSPVVFAGPGRVPEGALNKFFSKEQFVRCMHGAGSGDTSSMSNELEFGADAELYGSCSSGRRQPERRRTQDSDHFETDDQSVRKRARGPGFRSVNGSDVPIMVTTTKRGIKAGDGEGLWAFYEQRFKNCQQNSCKLLAKAWVKAIEPKKQSNHPYTGSDEGAPDWWPKPWGPSKDDRVRHKEPDHLYKRERVYLLVHILKMVVLPNHRQHPDIQKLNLDIRKLKEVTIEAMTPFWNDKDSPGNARKKPYLDEIFRVAKHEERYLDGQIDADTEMYVVADDKIPENYLSDDTDDSPNMREDNKSRSNPRSIASSSASSTSPAKTLAHPLIQPTSTDQSSPGSLHGGHFMEDLPVRGGHYSSPLVGPDMGGEYVGGGSMGSQSSGYAVAGGSAMYPQPWQPGTTAPTSSSMYAYTGPQPGPSQNAFAGQPSIALPSQPYLGQFPEELPGRAYAHNHSPIYRHGGVSASVSHPQGYPPYLSHDGRSLQAPNLKPESMSRGSLQ